MASVSESVVEESRLVRNRGLPPKERIIDRRQAAQIEAERLKVLAPATYRRSAGGPSTRQDFEAFSRQYDQLANERHVWRFARPDGSTYETSWRGLGTGTTAQASADLLGHRVIGEVIPTQGTSPPARGADKSGREPRVTPPQLGQAQPPSGPPPLPDSKRISKEERGLAQPVKAPTRGAEKRAGEGASAKRPGKPSSGMEERIRGYRDVDPPPRLATEKLKPVHNVTTAHQEKVRDLVNWAIQSATAAAKPGTEPNVVLKSAQDIVARLRKSDIPDAADNLIFRDADHYLAARTQEFIPRTAFLLYEAMKKSNPGFMSAEQMMKMATRQPSSETMREAVGPLGANQLYENKKLQEFAQQARGAPDAGAQYGAVGEHASAAGGTEWELLGMLDFERYDVNGPKTVPHLLVELPGKGESYTKSPEVPAYLRDEAKRIIEKMQDARFAR